MRAMKELRQLKEEEKLYEEKIKSMGKVMKMFLEDWPGSNCHDQSRCTLPVHPCCIQRLERPPALSVSDARLGSDKWIHPGLTSLAMDIELMLGARPKYACMDKCREHIAEITAAAKQNRMGLEGYLKHMMGAVQPSSVQEWESLMVDIGRWFRTWMKLARQELHFVEACLAKLPDNPTLLYAMPPSKEALHFFYPALYPTVTEPADVKTYGDIVKEFQVWQKQMMQQQESIKAIRAAQEHLEEQTFQEIFGKWGKHQNKLVHLCNKLLQYHIIAQKLPSEKAEKLPSKLSPKDLLVQWMADELFTARVEANQKAFDSWLATAHWCYQVAKVRTNSDQDTAYSSPEGGKITKTKLSLFEAVRPMEIGKSFKPGKDTMDLMEKKLMYKGEPLDQPGSSARLLENKDHILNMMAKAGQKMTDAQRALDLVLERQRRREQSGVQED